VKKYNGLDFSFLCYIIDNGDIKINLSIYATKY